MKRVRHMIVKWGVCPWCKKATEFYSNKCHGCGRIVNFDEIIEDE